MIVLRWVENYPSSVSTAYLLRLSACPSSLDVVFVLDLSGSVEDEYNLIVDFTRRTAAGLDVDSDRVRVGVVTYDYNVTNTILLNQYIQRGRNFTDALNFIHDLGRTNTQVPT